jgi:hypothetical protein
VILLATPLEADPERQRETERREIDRSREEREIYR